MLFGDAHFINLFCYEGRMKSVVWASAGILAGLIGAAIWMAIAHFANMEIGWIAWGIGFLVGISVRLAAHTADIDESPTLGTYAAAVAVGSIALAKYGIYYMNVVAAGLGEMIPFSVMFSPFDALWFGLACITAFKIGTGSTDD